MEYMHELKDKLCDELEEIARKGELGAGDLEIIHKLTDTIKNIDKIEMMKEDGGYSQAGDWEIENLPKNKSFTVEISYPGFKPVKYTGERTDHDHYVGITYLEKE